MINIVLNFDRLYVQKERKWIADSVQAITDICGKRPVG